MTRTPWPGIAIVLALALVWQTCTASRAQQAAARAALRADSVAAAADTTRVISTRALRVLGDSLRGVERRVVQERQRADALDRALGRERIARAGLGIQVDSLRARLLASSDVTGADSIRRITYGIDTIPYYGEAVVWVPPAPRTPTLDLSLSIRPIPLQLRLGCGGPVQGIRPATATLIGPSWATLTLDSLTQSPDLCRSPALQPRQPSRVKWMAVGAGTLLLLQQLLK